MAMESGPCQVVNQVAVTGIILLQPEQHCLSVGGHLEFSESFEQCAKREVGRSPNALGDRLQMRWLHRSAIHVQVLEETGLRLSDPSFAAVENSVFSATSHFVTIFMREDVEEVGGQGGTGCGTQRNGLLCLLDHLRAQLRARTVGACRMQKPGTWSQTSVQGGNGCRSAPFQSPSFSR